MRSTLLFALPLLAAVPFAPASAQISGRVHIDIPIGRQPAPVVYDRRPPGRAIVVVDYSRRYFGDWRKDYRRWDVVTLYFAGGRYYERPFRDARPVRLFRYRDRYFFPPNDRDWDRQHGRDWDRDWNRDNDRSNGRGNGPGYPPGRGNDRNDRDDRDGRGNGRGRGN